MVDVAKVKMFNIQVATVRWDERYETAQLEYAHDFVGRGVEPSPLMMPVREGRVYHWPEIAKNCGVPETIVERILPNMVLNP